MCAVRGGCKSYSRSSLSNKILIVLPEVMVTMLRNNATLATCSILHSFQLTFSGQSTRICALKAKVKVTNVQIFVQSGIFRHLKVNRMRTGHSILKAFCALLNANMVTVYNRKGRDC
jgi:hypothetical protein